MSQVDELLRRYMERVPEARRAHHHDPMYRAQVTLLSRLLGIVDMALEDNDIPADVRERVIRTALYGAMPGEVDAEQRMVDHDRLVQAASTIDPVHALGDPAAGPVCRACVFGGCPTHPDGRYGYRRSVT